MFRLPDPKSDGGSASSAASTASSAPRHRSIVAAPPPAAVDDEGVVAVAVAAAEDESPFSRWRRLRHDPRFIEAVTDFCRGEERARFDIGLEYASWWAPRVRSFRVELLVILERDIAVELLVERQGRAHILQEEDDEAFALERYWAHKQLYAFWPRWVEYAHGVLAARIWTQQSLERLELHMRFASVGQREVEGRLAIYASILNKVAEVPLEWGGFVPPLVQAERESQRRLRAQVAARQEADLQALRELYRRQSDAFARQQEQELHRALEAGRLRIEWAAQQGWEQLFRKCFPIAAGNDAGNGYDDGDDDDLAAYRR